MGRPTLRRPPEWGVEPVPPEARTLGFFDLFVLWSSLGVGLLVLAAGAFMLWAFGLSLAEALAVSLVGSIAGSLLLAAAGLPGSRAGVPTMVSLRPIIGRRGSWAPSAFNAFQLLAWAAFELLVMGLAATVIVGKVFGPMTAAVFVPLFGAIVFFLALGGPLAVVRHWLEKFAIWFVYGTTALLASYLVLRLSEGGVDLGARPFPASYAGWPSVLLALDLVIVMPISWWPLVADYNRFGRSPRTSFAATTLGYAAANTAYYALGAALAAFAAVAISGPAYPDFLAAIALLGLGGVPLLIILVDETDNAFANVYSTAVSAQNVAPRTRQALLVAAATGLASVGAIALVAAGQGLGDSFELFLIFIGGVFVPLLGVVVADTLAVRRGGYADEEFVEGAPAFRWGALASWAVGVAVYYAVHEGLLPGRDIMGSTLLAFAAAAALHIVAARLGHRKPAPAPA
jgi:putative hydroxymethylpyrimidine transporter CytX